MKNSKAIKSQFVILNKALDNIIEQLKKVI